MNRPMNQNFLLLGISGSGKSSTLKTIVQKDNIDVQGGWKTVTDIFQEEQGFFEGRVMKVVDTPGFFSTNIKDKAAHYEQYKRSVDQLLQRHPEGIHALVLVLSYGKRFGEEDLNTIRILKEIFGENWLKNRGVVVVTSGDNFNFDVQGSDTTFPDWCKEQRGPMGQIFKDCSYRCVLFDNVTRDQKVINNQLSRLVSVTNSFGNTPTYTHESFIKVHKRQVMRPTVPPKTTVMGGGGASSSGGPASSLRSMAMSTITGVKEKTSNVIGSFFSKEGKNESGIDTVSSVQIYSKLPETHNHNKETSTPNMPPIKAPRTVNKEKLLTARQDIIKIIKLLRKNLEMVHKEAFVNFFKSKVEIVKKGITTQESMYFEKTFSSLEQLLDTENKNTMDVDKWLQEPPLMDKVHEIYDQMEKDLDVVLTRWERDPDY